MPSQSEHKKKGVPSRIQPPFCRRLVSRPLSHPRPPLRCTPARLSLCEHQGKCGAALRLGPFAPPRPLRTALHPRMHHLRSSRHHDRVRADRLGAGSAPRPARLGAQSAPNDRRTSRQPAVFRLEHRRAFPLRPAQPVLREHGPLLGADRGRSLCFLCRHVAREWKRSGAAHLGALLDLLRALSDWRGLRGARQLRHAACLTRARRRLVGCTPSRAVGRVRPRARCALHPVVARSVSDVYAHDQAAP